MPGFNGTGPMGMGPRTGGGFGYCPPGSGPAPVRGSAGFYGVGRGGYPRGGGRGFAYGGGRGRGWRSFGPAAYPPAYPPAGGYPYGYPAGDEASFLKEQAEGLQAELDAVRRRLSELEKSGDEKGEK